MKALAILLALVFSGAVQALISPPAGWIAVHPVSWVPAFAVFSRLEGRRAFLAGWLVGASANAAIFYWLIGTVTRFSNLPPFLAVLVLGLFALAMGLYVGVFAWGFGPVRRACRGHWPVGIAAWFTAIEFLNPQLFPYYQGVAWYQVPSVFLVSSLTGVSGVSFLVILCNGIFLQAVLAWRESGSDSPRARVSNAAVFLALVAVAIGWSAARLAQVERAEVGVSPLRVALVQPNYDIERRRAMRAQRPEIFAEDLVALSAEALLESGDIDVFIWPEGALGDDFEAPQNAAVIQFVRETGAEVWTGAYGHQLDAEGRRQTYNSAYRVFGDGGVDARYDKTILIPFGEFMPFADTIPALRRIRGPGNFARGDGLAIYADAPARFVFLICYEAIRSSYVRTGARQAPELLVNLTVDAWYGDSSEQSQHLMLAAIQSAQYGVPLLRSTTTGISAIVDARGVITDQTGVYTREILVREVKPVFVPSVYARLGDWFAWGCVAAAAVLLFLQRRRGR